MRSWSYLLVVYLAHFVADVTYVAFMLFIAYWAGRGFAFDRTWYLVYAGWAVYFCIRNAERMKKFVMEWTGTRDWRV
jgi:hypothetical protein